MSPIFGYWNIRGRGEAARLLLHYLGIQFEDKQYNLDTTPQEWFSSKFSLGLDFPNLPYYIDGDLKLTQSAAILEYIASANGLVPECKKHRAKLYMLQDEISDLQQSFGMICFSPEFNKAKAGFLEALPNKLECFERYLGDKPWISGDEISYPDFSLCEVFSQLTKLEPTILDRFPKLKAYFARFQDLPNIKKYMSSEDFKKRACMPPKAAWRGI